MTCKECLCKKSRIIGTEHNRLHTETIRKHKCTNCGHVFYTSEVRDRTNNKKELYSKWNIDRVTRSREERKKIKGGDVI